jgi:hypothetical protein
VVGLCRSDVSASGGGTGGSSTGAGGGSSSGGGSNSDWMGSAFLKWTFPPREGVPQPSCAAANVSYVDVSIDGQVTRAACAQGQSGMGFDTGPLLAGPHALRLSAIVDGFERLRADATLTIQAGAQGVESYEPGWIIGGLHLSWHIVDGTTMFSCSDVGIQSMFVNFTDSTNQLVYAGSGLEYPCNANVDFTSLYAGQYSVFVQGVAMDGLTYKSDFNHPPQVTVSAGVFTAAAPSLDLPVFVP